MCYVKVCAWGGSDTDDLMYDNTGSPCRERELERRRLERQCQLRREPEHVERRQSGVLSKLLFFSSTSRPRSFLFKSFFPATEHSADFLQVFGKGRILFIRDAFVFPSYL